MADELIQIIFTKEQFEKLIRFHDQWYGYSYPYVDISGVDVEEMMDVISILTLTVKRKEVECSDRS